MKMPYQALRFEIAHKVCRITLNRPEVHNAFDETLIEELARAFGEAASMDRSQVRAVVLSGAGTSFCAGADVNWMRSSLSFSQEENRADALRMAHMFETINTCPLPVIARVHGLALGGGAGLLAVSDIVVAAENTKFAFSEAKLGIAPSVISPYVLAKIGSTHARALFLTAERFDAKRALQIGLAHVVTPLDRLDEQLDHLLHEIMTSSPNGISAAKQLIARVPTMQRADATQLTADTIAGLRVSPEGQEGLRAFIEKRKPKWAADASR